MAEIWREPRMSIDGRLVTAFPGRTFNNVNPVTVNVIGPAAKASLGMAELLGITTFRSARRESIAIGAR